MLLRRRRMPTSSTRRTRASRRTSQRSCKSSTLRQQGGLQPGRSKHQRPPWGHSLEVAPTVPGLSLGCVGLIVATIGSGLARQLRFARCGQLPLCCPILIRSKGTGTTLRRRTTLTSLPSLRRDSRQKPSEEHVAEWRKGTLQLPWVIRL